MQLRCLFKKPENHLPLPGDLQDIVISYICEGEEDEKEYIEDTYYTMYASLLLLGAPAAAAITCAEQGKHSGWINQSIRYIGTPLSAILTLIGLGLLIPTACVTGTIDIASRASHKIKDCKEDKEIIRIAKETSFFLDLYHLNRQRKKSKSGLAEKLEISMIINADMIKSDFLESKDPRRQIQGEELLAIYNELQFKLHNMELLNNVHQMSTDSLTDLITKIAKFISTLDQTNNLWVQKLSRISAIITYIDYIIQNAAPEQTRSLSL